MKKTRILLYKELFPIPVRSGTDLDTLNLLKRLQKNFDVHFVTVRSPETTQKDIDELGQIVNTHTVIEGAFSKNLLVRIALSVYFRLFCLITRHPLGAIYARRAPIVRTIKRLHREQVFDVSIYTYWNAVQLAALSSPCSFNIAYLLDAQFMEAERETATTNSRAKTKRLKNTSKQILQYEKRTLPTVHRIITISESERRIYRNLFPAMDVRYVESCIDGSAYQFQGRDVAAKQVIFLGNFRHKPNVKAAEFLAERIWPSVLREHSEAKLLILGKFADQFLAEYRLTPGVEVLGEVEDVRPYLAEASLFVAPMLSGTGVKIKILEAMAAGLPIITSILGAEAFAATERNGVFICETAGDFVTQISNLFADEDLLSRAGQAAREYILEHHDIGAPNTTGFLKAFSKP